MDNQIEQWATSCIIVQGIAIVDSESIDTNEPPDSLHRVGLPVTISVLSMDIVYFTMKPIKIVSYNTYLICNRFNQNRVTHPERRATKICRDFLSNKPPSRNRVPHTTSIKPDLCFFQEGRKQIFSPKDWSFEQIPGSRRKFTNHWTIIMFDWHYSWILGWIASRRAESFYPENILGFYQATLTERFFFFLSFWKF